MKLMPFFFSSCLMASAFCGCTKKSGPVISQMSQEQLALRGKAIYELNCIACHNTDPSKEGVLGPAIQGSNRALIEARVLRAAYPADYKHKRSTQQMPALPQLEKEIPTLEAFLNSGIGVTK